MSDLPPILDEADVFLGKLAKLDLMAAQHVNACLLDTTDPEQVAKLAQAYARCSRQVRQTLACHAKLKHDREKAARLAEQHERWRKAGRPIETDEDLKKLAIDERTFDLSDAMGRVISHAAAGDEARHTALADRFDRELDDWEEEPDFLDLDLDDHVKAACRRLGLPEQLAEAWDELPEPTFVPDPAPRIREMAERYQLRPAPAPNTAARRRPPWPNTG